MVLELGWTHHALILTVLLCDLVKLLRVQTVIFVEGSNDCIPWLDDLHWRDFKAVAFAL